jgi:hypothetical protein
MFKKELFVSTQLCFLNHRVTMNKTTLTKTVSKGHGCPHWQLIHVIYSK